MKSDIGECVSVLYFKRWGKTPVNGKLKSQQWWRNQLASLVNSPEIIKIELGPEATYDIPVPFEVEMGWTEDTSQCWLGWIQKAFKRRYERETTS